MHLYTSTNTPLVKSEVPKGKLISPTCYVTTDIASSKQYFDNSGKHNASLI